MMYLNRRYFLAALCVLGLAALIVWYPHIQFWGERLSLAYRPSAERAFNYGEQHFNALHASGYDVAHAEYFFNETEKMDPKYPYLQHELARIAFLKGDFPTAMRYINRQIELMGDTAPNSYYIRGLIEGFAGDNDASIKDYEHYLQFNPTNWAAINDYSWVLLKAGRPTDAVVATARGLEYFPENAWLLNTNATALYEMKLYKSALEQAKKASLAAKSVTTRDWLTAYPGNDPRVAAEGVKALQQATEQNMHTIQSLLATSTVQS